MEPNAQKQYIYLLSHPFKFSLRKRLHYQWYQNPLKWQNYQGKVTFVKLPG